MMPGAAHHQGSCSLPEFQEVLVREFTFSLFLTLNSACLLIILFFLCSRHDVKGSLATSSRHMLWLTWARRRSTSPSIRRLRRGLQQPEHPHPRDSVHGDRKGTPRRHMGSSHRTPFWRSHHEGRRREEARPLLDRQQPCRHSQYADSLPASGKDHRLDPANTPTA